MLLNLLSLAYDRFVAVCFSIHYMRLMTETNVKKIIFGIWLYVFIFISLPFMGWELWRPGNKCMGFTAHPKAYQTMFLLPAALKLILVAVFNIIIAVVALKTSKVMPSGIPNPSSKGTQNTGSNASEAQQGSASTSLKITKMLLIVVGVFYLCWLPYVILTLVFALPPDSWKKYGPPEYITVLQESSKVMVILNAAINPFVYAKKNAQFRAAFKKLLKFRQMESGLTQTH